MGSRFAPNYVRDSTAHFGDVHNHYHHAETVSDVSLGEVLRQRQAIADWFSPAEFADLQTDQLSRRGRGTGQWFLTHQTYQHWRDEPGATLLCPGIPGAGKSIMAATIVEDLQQTFRYDKSVATIYFYCYFNRQSVQDLCYMLAVLSRQLFQEQTELPEAVTALYETHRARETRPSVKELRSLLRVLAALYARIFVVIDALDECDNMNQARDRFIHELASLQNQTEKKISVLATTRFIPDVMQSFLGCPQLEIRAHEGDVEAYLDECMKSLPRFVSRDGSLQTKIKSQVIAAANGMFLLARLHFDSLRDKMTPRQMEHALAKLENGSSALDIAYDDVLDRIDHQPAGWRTLARKVLLWITHATRELTIEELQEAIAIEPGWEDIDGERDIVDEDLIITACLGLVEIDKESRVARLVHHTTQTYFERVRSTYFPEGKAEITRSCLAYLKMKAFDHNECTWHMDYTALVRRYRFLFYAGKNWGCHARAVSDSELHTEIASFLSDPGYLRFSSQVTYGSIRIWGSMSRRQNSSAAHICAKFGLVQILQILLDQGEDPDSKDSSEDTPLLVAIEAGHASIVQLLLARSDVNVDAVGNMGKTALFKAAEKGILELVQHLLAGHNVDVNTKKSGRSKKSVLCAAANNGHVEIVRLLLARPQLDVNTPTEKGKTALYMAAKKGHTEIVQQLLARPDVDVNAKDIKGVTALEVATQKGHTVVRELLLSAMWMSDVHTYAEQMRDIGVCAA